MEPAVYAIRMTQAMINIVRITCLDGMSPCGDRLREVVGVNCVTGGPPLQVFERLAETFQNLAVGMFHLALWRHGCHKPTNSVNDQGKSLIARAQRWLPLL
jgi:hypothetical protein